MFAALDLLCESVIATIRSDVGVAFFIGVTYLGETLVVTILLLVASVYFWRRDRYALYALLASVAGSLASSTLFKALVGRMRPPYALVVEVTPSFPSGHSVVAVSFYLLLAMLLTYEERHSFSRVTAVRLSTFLLVGLIAFSRLYLGVHYATDVLAGLALGGVWAFFSYRWYQKRSGSMEKSSRA